MAKKKSNNNGVDKVPSPNQVNSSHEMDKIAADGMTLLDKEPIKNPIPEPVKTIILDEKNPYQRAKTQIYAKFPLWKRIETDRMIANKEYDNRHYIQYCKDLLFIGDGIAYEEEEKAKRSLTPIKK